MTPIFNSATSLMAVILVMVAFSFWVQKFKGFKLIGPAMTTIILGIILSNVGIVPGYHDVYGVLQSFCVPVSISLFLLNVDLKAIAKMSKQPLMAIFSAVFCVGLAATAFGMIFAGHIDEGWKVAGMFVGTYTGGSANLTAIATGLEATNQTIAAANAADYVIGMPALLLMFVLPGIAKKSKLVQKIWPYQFSDSELQGGEDSEKAGLMSSLEWSIQDIATLLAIAFSIVAVSTTLSGLLFPAAFASAGKVLLNSTISIAVAQIPAVRKLRGTQKLGMFFGMIFLSIIGFCVSLQAFLGSAFSITLFCFCVIVGSTVLHLLLTRLMKIKMEYVMLGIIAAIADGPTAAMVASNTKWTSLINIGLLMGVLGGVCGNYVGIGVAYLIRALIM